MFLDSQEDQFADWIVSDHVRSLQADHLMDVAPSDRHTVTPWSKGKVDSRRRRPIFLSSAENGWIIEGSGGGGDRIFAAEAYNQLLTWPSKGDVPHNAGTLSKDGFNVRHWQRGGMEYWAISDLNDEELGHFVQMYQQRAGDGAK